MNRLFLWVVAFGCGCAGLARAEGLLGTAYAEAGYRQAKWQDNPAPIFGAEAKPGNEVALKFNFPVTEHLDSGVSLAQMKVSYDTSRIRVASSGTGAGSGSSGSFAEPVPSNYTGYNGTTGAYFREPGYISSAQLFRLFFSYEGTTNGTSTSTVPVGGINLTVREYMARLTRHDQQDWGTPFVSFEAGWEETKWKIFGQEFTDGSFKYRVSLGVEFEFDEWLVVTPFIATEEATEDKATRIASGGLRVHVALHEQVGLQLNVTKNRDRDMYYGGGLTVRF